MSNPPKMGDSMVHFAGRSAARHFSALSEMHWRSKAQAQRRRQHLMVSCSQRRPNQKRALNLVPFPCLCFRIVGSNLWCLHSWGSSTVDPQFATEMGFQLGWSWDLQAQQNWGLDPETIWREVGLNSSRCGWKTTAKWAKNKCKTIGEVLAFHGDRGNIQLVGGFKHVSNTWDFSIEFTDDQVIVWGVAELCWAQYAQCQVSPGLPSMWISQILYWSSLAEGHDLVSTKASVLCRSMPKYGISPGHIDWFFQHLAEYILDCQS